MRGQPSPVSNGSAPVKLASSIGTSCRSAYTASTANSGSVCSHARIASANPWAMKNCADSAAQAISKAANRMEGAVHNIDHGPTSRIGSAASNSSAQTATPTRGLSEGDFMVFRDRRMLLELRARRRKIRAKMRAAALLAAERATCDQQGHRMDVAKLEAGNRWRRCRLH